MKIELNCVRCWFKVQSYLQLFCRFHGQNLVTSKGIHLFRNFWPKIATHRIWNAKSQFCRYFSNITALLDFHCSTFVEMSIFSSQQTINMETTVDGEERRTLSTRALTLRDTSVSGTELCLLHFQSRTRKDASWQY